MKQKKMKRETLFYKIRINKTNNHLQKKLYIKKEKIKKKIKINTQ